MDLSNDERIRKKMMSDRTLTYGEVLCLSFIPVLEALEPKQGDVFYDVGCGAAIPVTTAALALGDVLAKARGIELLDDLTNLA